MIDFSTLPVFSDPSKRLALNQLTQVNCGFDFAMRLRLALAVLLVPANVRLNCLSECGAIGHFGSPQLTFFVGRFKRMP
jgi:hypothetical protein